MAGRYGRRGGYQTTSSARVARWMDLRYAGVCAQCHVAIAAGGRAFYDPSDRTVCCTSIDCARAHGVTREVWQGSPVSGGWVTELSATRMGGRAAFARATRYGGRCTHEDYPCCGCDS